jgi:hypothetical protein
MRHQRRVRPGEALCPDRVHPVRRGLPKVGPSALARIGDLDHRARALFHSNHLEGQLIARLSRRLKRLDLRGAAVEASGIPPVEIEVTPKSDRRCRGPRPAGRDARR